MMLDPSGLSYASAGFRRSAYPYVLAGPDSNSQDKYPWHINTPVGRPQTYRCRANVYRVRSDMALGVRGYEVPPRGLFQVGKGNSDYLPTDYYQMVASTILTGSKRSRY